MYRRLIAASIVIVGISLILAAPASADAGGFGYTDGPNVGAGASDGGSAPVPRASSGSSPERCEYQTLTAEDNAMWDRLVNEGLWAGRGDGPGTWYRKICYDANGLSSATIVWAPQRVDPQQLAQQALSEAPIPRPGINMNPSSDQGAVTNVETWLWIDRSQWQPVSASASAGNVSVTTTATPNHVVFNMGNGDEVTCMGPGTPYDTHRPSADQSTDCSYTYHRSSADQPNGRYTVTATVFYSVAWNATGIAAGGALAPVTQSSTVAIRVAEIQALNQ